VGTFSQLGGLSLRPDTSSLCVEFLIGRIACFAWGTHESLRAYRMARRRLALGLADPVVANRFLLFGTWFGAMGVMPIVFVLTRLTGGGAAFELATAIGPKVVGTVMVIALVLTFFPPPAYRVWVSGTSKVKTS
jgi:hypothetical protein